MGIRREHIEKDAVEEEDIIDDNVPMAKLKGIKHGTVSVSIPQIAPTTTTNVDAAVSGVVTTDRLLVECQEELSHGLVHIAAWVPLADTIRVRISNWSADTVSATTKVFAWQRNI